MLLAIATCVLYVLIRDIDVTTYDDGLFFKRFARNFLDHGSFAWNVADGPVHGLTSQLQMFLATVVLAITDQYWIVAMRWLAAACLIGCSAVLLRRCDAASSAAAWILVAITSPIVLGTLPTAMETTLALLTVAVALDRVRHEPTQSALATVLVYLARPDAALIVAIAHTWMWRTNRRRVLTYFGVLALACSGTLVVAKLYYGTALPLSFHMKTHGLDAYAPEIVQMSLPDKWVHAFTFAVVASPFVCVAIAGRRRDSSEGIALVIAAVVFVGYHLALTTEIMGMKARFYLPALVPLTLAAALAWPEFERRVPLRGRAMFVLAWWTMGMGLYLSGTISTAGSDFFLERIHGSEYLVTGVGASLLMLWPRALDDRRGLGLVAAASAGLLLYAHAPRISVVHPDRTILRQHAREVTTVRGIFDVQLCLPGLKTVYHSEMGVTGLVLDTARAVDLAGILSPGPVLENRDFEDYCQEDQPEVIFLPHRNYKAMNAAIMASDCFRNYLRVVDRSSSALHIRRDLAPEFLGCAQDIWRWQSPATQHRLRAMATFPTPRTRRDPPTR